MIHYYKKTLLTCLFALFCLGATSAELTGNSGPSYMSTETYKIDFFTNAQSEVEWLLDGQVVNGAIRPISGNSIKSTYTYTRTWGIDDIDFGFHTLTFRTKNSSFVATLNIGVALPPFSEIQGPDFSSVGATDVYNFRIFTSLIPHITWMVDGQPVTGTVETRLGDAYFTLRHTWTALDAGLHTITVQLGAPGTGFQYNKTLFVSPIGVTERVLGEQFSTVGKTNLYLIKFSSFAGSQATWKINGQVVPGTVTPISGGNSIYSLTKTWNPGEEGNVIVSWGTAAFSRSTLVTVTPQGSDNWRLASNDLAEEQSLISIYPNPARDVLNVSTEEEGSLEVWSIRGQLLDSYSLSKGENSLDISNIPSGNVIVKTRTNNATSSEMLVKE